jgi:8-oxo-dGTP pyrophosphatase MutT (NUDIX family)
MRRRLGVSERIEGAESGQSPDVSAIFNHPDIAKLRAKLDSRESIGVEEPGSARRAAVALIFRAGADGSPELLFIKRAEYPGDPWSGQVALPGGREEVGDANLAETATRETREETGLDLERCATVIGRLDDFRPQTVRLPEIIVRPYVVLLKCDAELSLSDEVAMAFWVPLESLKRADAWREMSVHARGVQMNRRAFQHQGHVIWGMTERILAQLLALLS